jgi:hypothetical protein
MVWYEDGSPITMRLRVERDPAGRVDVILESWSTGIDPAAPPPVPFISPEVATLMQEVEKAILARCQTAPDLKIQYTGLYRTVTVREFISLSMDDSNMRGYGWVTTAQVAMDERLTRIVGEIEHEDQLGGEIEVPADAQWLALPLQDDVKLLLGGAGTQKLSQPLAEAAQRYDAKAPGPSLASLVPADAPMLPPGFVPRVVLQLVYHKLVPDRRASSEHLIVPLDLRDAVFGKGAATEVTLNVAQFSYKVRATLVPTVPLAPTPGRKSTGYAGTLTVHINDDRGNAWHHAYPATGKIDHEGDTVIAPYGLDIPRGLTPSPEAEALHANFPASDPYTGIHFYVEPELAHNPRR